MATARRIKTFLKQKVAEKDLACFEAPLWHGSGSAFRGTNLDLLRRFWLAARKIHQQSGPWEALLEPQMQAMEALLPPLRDAILYDQLTPEIRNAVSQLPEHLSALTRYYKTDWAEADSRCREMDLKITIEYNRIGKLFSDRNGIEILNSFPAAAYKLCGREPMTRNGVPSLIWQRAARQVLTWPRGQGVDFRQQYKEFGLPKGMRDLFAARGVALSDMALREAQMTVVDGFAGQIQSMFQAVPPFGRARSASSRGAHLRLVACSPASPAP
jgi:hypothetical protein